MNVESRRAAAPPIVLAATLGLAAACWAVTAWLMDGMDMGVATRPGAFGFFAAVWVTMMAAMMLPGAAPAVVRYVRMIGTVRAALPFAGSYLAIWALAGVVAYALDQPHGSLAAGAVVIAAGAYELTPVKRHFRRRCREAAGLWAGVRAVLRRLEYRADGDAGSAERDEPVLDVGSRRPRLRPEAAAREGRDRRSAGAGAHRARVRDRHRALAGSGAHATNDVTTTKGDRARPRAARPQRDRLLVAPARRVRPPVSGRCQVVIGGVVYSHSRFAAHQLSGPACRLEESRGSSPPPRSAATSGPVLNHDRTTGLRSTCERSVRAGRGRGLSRRPGCGCARRAFGTGAVGAS